MLHEMSVRTRRRNELIDITTEIRAIVGRSGIKDGLCHLFVPHTTAAITINERADPDVRLDIEEALSKMVPEKGGFRHAEGNSDAHVKSTLVGVSTFLPVKDGDLVLGAWQAVFFCEFDGPRTRRCFVRVLNTG
jgi:secondary thiamine-phosphate synthase enzyme